MLDLRIIIAVILTLWGIAIGISQGVMDLKSISSFSLSDIQLPFFKNEPTLPINAEFYSEKMPSFTKVFRKPLPKLDLTFTPNGKFLIRNSEVSFAGSIASIELINYRGILKFGEILSIDGKADFIKMGNITLKDVDVRTGPLNPLNVKFYNAPPSNYEFEKVSGVISSSGASVNILEKPITMISFTGDSIFNFVNNTYIFNGKIAKLYSGGNPILTLNR